MLVVDQLTKKYDNIVANHAISFFIEEGEVFGLLGPNGSGKTTLISQIIGFQKPTKGAITVAGVDMISNPHLSRRFCSLQPQENISLRGLTPRQAIELTGKIRGGNKQHIRKRTAELLQLLQLEDWADKQSDHLSGGITRLVTFCMAIIVPGKLVILDEPTNDVDPIRRRLLWEQVRIVANNGAAVLLITHNVLEAERSVDRLAIINNGRLIGVGTPASFKGEFDKMLRLELTLHRHEENIILPNYVSIIDHTKQKVIATISKQYSQEIMNWVFTMQDTNKIEEFTVSAATLEDAYANIIKRANNQNSKGEQYAFS